MMHARCILVACDCAEVALCCCTSTCKLAKSACWAAGNGLNSVKGLALCVMFWNTLCGFWTQLCVLGWDQPQRTV